MGILQAIFGSQMGQAGMQSGFTPVNQLPQTQVQQAPQTLGLVQDILSQRFQPQPQDVAQSIFMNGTGLGTNGGITTPEAQITSRLAPVMDIAKTLGTLNQSQLEIAKLNEQMRHDQATELQNPQSQPITTSPTTVGGVLPPSQTIPGPVRSIPNMMQNNSQVPQIAPQTNNIPQTIQNNAIDSRPATPQREANALSALTGGAGDSVADTSMAQPTITKAGPMDNVTYIQGQPSPQYQPLYRGNVPYTDGLEKGFQWAQGPDGKTVAIQILGVPQKGANGELLTTDPATGQTTQGIPKNPDAQAKFEANIQKISTLFDQLNKTGGSIEEGGNFFKNKLNQLENTDGVTIGDTRIIPGGQTLMQGTQTQAIKDQIQSLIKQTTPIYMQAMGITPGMERAVAAQQMLQSALGGDTGKSRQANQASLANLSAQAGTGQFAQQYKASQPVSIITPDGQRGTVAAGHLQDLLNAGGKLAQ